MLSRPHNHIALPRICPDMRGADELRKPDNEADMLASLSSNVRTRTSLRVVSTPLGPKKSSYSQKTLQVIGPMLGKQNHYRPMKMT